MANINISGAFKAGGQALFKIAGSRAQRAERELQRLHDVHMQELREKSATNRQLESEQRSETRYQGRLEETRGYAGEVRKDARTYAGGVAKDKRSQDTFSEYRKGINALVAKYQSGDLSGNEDQYVAQIQNYLRNYAEGSPRKDEMTTIAARAAQLTEGKGVMTADAFTKMMNEFKAYGGGGDGGTSKLSPLDPNVMNVPPVSDLFNIPSGVKSSIESGMEAVREFGGRKVSDVVTSGVSDLFGEFKESFGRFVDPSKPLVPSAPKPYERPPLYQTFPQN